MLVCPLVAIGVVVIGVVVAIRRADVQVVAVGVVAIKRALRVLIVPSTIVAPSVTTWSSFSAIPSVLARAAFLIV